MPGCACLFLSALCNFRVENGGEDSLFEGEGLNMGIRYVISRTQVDKNTCIVSVISIVTEKSSILTLIHSEMCVKISLSICYQHMPMLGFYDNNQQ